MTAAKPIDPVTFALPAILDSAAASALLVELTARRGKSLTVDASAVARVGGLCMQVLLGARTAWAEDGLELSVINPSTAFWDGLSLMGAPDLAPAAAILED